MKFEEVLKHFGVVDVQGHTAVCYCPLHDEANPSLTITEGEDGRIHMNCNEGCKNEDILKAVGLTEEDLYEKDPLTIDVPPGEGKDEPRKLKIISSEELSQMDLKPIEMIVDGMIPVGLTLVVAPPKYGKSWMMLQTCLSVAEGTDFLGHKTHQCGVLYLPLEDGYARLKERQAKILTGHSAPEKFFIANEAEDMESGLFDQLEEILKEHPDIKLIIIDTLQKIRAEAKRGENVYATDYKEMAGLKHFADEHDIAIVAVHHTRKMQDPTDPFANISGSNGIAGATDTMIVLSRDKRGDDTTRVSIIGRDVEASDFQIKFNQISHRWELIGTEEEYEAMIEKSQYEKNPIVQTVRKLLDQTKEWKGNSSDLIEAGWHYSIAICMSATKVGKELAKLGEQFYKYDGIFYTPISNGSGAKKHHFSSYVEKPEPAQVAEDSAQYFQEDFESYEAPGDTTTDKETIPSTDDDGVMLVNGVSLPFD